MHLCIQMNFDSRRWRTSDIIQLIRGLNVHAYADDLQVYGHTTPSESSILQSRISDCIESIQEWMRSNRLRLNPTKTEFIWVGSSNCLGKFESTDPIRVSCELVAPVMKVRDLGVIIDSELTLIPHVDSVVKLCLQYDTIQNFCRRAKFCHGDNS